MRAGTISSTLSLMSGSDQPPPLWAAIQAWSEQRGWNQVDLAREAGVSDQTLLNIKKGRSSGDRTLVRIAHALGATVEQLRAGPDSAPGSPSEIPALQDVDSRLLAEELARRAGRGDSLNDVTTWPAITTTTSTGTYVVIFTPREITPEEATVLGRRASLRVLAVTESDKSAPIGSDG